MLSLPDIKQKQILLIQTSEYKMEHIKWQNDNIVFERDGKVENRASAHRILAIFIVGDCTFTTTMIQKLLRLGVTTFFLKYNLSFYTSFGARAEGNFLVRNQQYHSKNKTDFELSQNLIATKIQNQALLLKQAKNDDAYHEIMQSIKQIQTAKNSDTLLGIEGNASKYFFTNYYSKIGWLRRLPRTKFDIPNLLLDIGYTYLFNFIDSLLRLYGFDTYKGVYHKLFFQRKSLSCDLMEPFRCIVDKALLKAYNLGQINPKDFENYKQAYNLKYIESKKYSKIFLDAIIDHKEDIFLYIQGYYRHFMAPEKHPFPVFKVK